MLQRNVGTLAPQGPGTATCLWAGRAHIYIRCSFAAVSEQLSSGWDLAL